MKTGFETLGTSLEQARAVHSKVGTDLIHPQTGLRQNIGSAQGFGLRKGLPEQAKINLSTAWWPLYYHHQVELKKH
jgi:hypothetical protein